MKKLSKIFSSLGIIILTALSFTSLSACSDDSKVKNYTVLSDFKGKKISYLSGAIYQSLLDDCPDIGAGNYTPVPFNSTTDAVQAVLSGNSDACITDEPVARLIVSQYKELAVHDEYVGVDKYATMFSKENEFYEPFSQEITRLIEDGTVDRLKNEWVYQLEGEPSIGSMESYNENYDSTLTNKTVRVCGIGTQMPLVYQEDETPLGLEVELLTIVAAKLNYKIEFNVNFSTYAGIALAVESGKYDAMIAGLSYTEDRAKVFNYTPIYYVGGSLLLYRKGYTKFNDIKDIDGETIGCVVGSSVYVDAIKEYLPQTYTDNKVIFYQSLSHCKIALQSGYISGYIDEYAPAKYYASLSGKTKILGNISKQMDYGFLYSDNLLAEIFKTNVDTYIAEARSNPYGNEIESLYSKWVYTSSKYGKIDTSQFPSDGSAGTIKVGVYSEVPPLAYLADDLSLTGFEIELLYMIASKYNYKLEFYPSTFASLISSLDSGSIDVLCGSITISEERKAKYKYTYYSKATLVLVVESDQQNEQTSIFTDFSDSFYNNFIKGNRYLLILEGLLITIVVTFFSIIFGTILGAILCWLRMRKNRFVSQLSKGVIIAIEGVPVLLILLIFYHIVFANFDLPSLIVSIIAFSIGFMPYFAEVFRSSIQSIDKGQIEAAKSTGFKNRQIVQIIVLPQAMKVALPVYLGECVSALKMTSIVGYIGLMDLTRASDLIQSLTFDALLPLIVSSLFYLLLSIGLSYLFKFFAKLLGKKDFSKKPIRLKDNWLDVRRRKSYIPETFDETKTCISIKGLTKSFDDGITVLDNIDVDINKGDVISIIGPSGTGKSTFIRCINRLEKPTSGSISIYGEEITGKREKTNMQMVFQSFNLWNHLSVIENIILGPIYIKCMPREKAVELAKKLLDKVGLGNRAYAYPDELSGGQKQRVAIARALAMEPQIILFDEPTSALDPTMIGEVLNVIRSLAKGYNLTMLIVTHEMKFAKTVSNRVFYMDEKIIYEDDTPSNIFEHPKRPLTRKFVKHIHTFECAFKKYEIDYPKLSNDINLFISKYTLDEKLINRTMLAVEEIIINSIILHSNNINLSIEFIESAQTINVVIGYDGDYNPYETFADEVSKKLFESSISNKRRGKEKEVKFFID